MGYAIRFEDWSSSQTRIKYLTGETLHSARLRRHLARVTGSQLQARGTISLAAAVAPCARGCLPNSTQSCQKPLPALQRRN